MIIAVDFDGILCENKFPDIGAPKYSVISLIRQLIDQGHEVVLWTSRAGDELVKAVRWCEDYGLHFAEVNENAPSNTKQYEDKYPEGTRKVYADIYIDDHNLEYVCNGDTANVYLCKQLKEGVKKWKTKVNSQFSSEGSTAQKVKEQ